MDFSVHEEGYMPLQVGSSDLNMVLEKGLLRKSEGRAFQLLWRSQNGNGILTCHSSSWESWWEALQMKRARKSSLLTQRAQCGQWWDGAISKCLCSVVQS